MIALALAPSIVSIRCQLCFPIQNPLIVASQALCPILLDNQQNKSSRSFARQLGLITDDAGHGIGNRLGGLGGKKSINIFPQNLSVNRGIFREFEDEIYKDVASGKNVFVRIVPKYAPGSTRPYEIVYQARIDGITRKETFLNPK